MGRKLSFVLAVAVFCPAVLAADEPKADSLSAMRHRFLYAQQGWGELGINQCVHAPRQTEVPLKLNGKVYENGLGHHAPGEIIVDLAGEYATFEALVGVQTQEQGEGSVVFKVFVDDEERFDSGVMKQNTPARPISVSVAGAQDLRLVATDAGDGMTCDCADWVNARLIRSSSPAATQPARVLDIAKFAQVVTSDPARLEGSHANRVQEYRAEDVYLDAPARPDGNGAYAVAPANGQPGCIGLKWLERRRLRTFGFELASGSAAPAADKLQVQCWVGESAWQGGWKPIAGGWSQDSSTWTFKPDWATVPDAQGSTRKVRLISPEPIAIKRFVALAPTPLAETSLQVRMEQPLGNEPGTVEIYNGEFVGNEAKLRTQFDQAQPLSLNVRHSKPRPWLSDTTVLRFRLTGAEFGVSVDDVLKNGCVYVRDYGLFITKSPGGPSLEEYKQKIAGQQTVLQQVRTMPDQTFAQAVEHVHNPAQDKLPMMLSLACDNHKLIVHRAGNIQFSPSPETDDKHVADKQDMSGRLSPKFGSGKNEKLSRGLDGGWMPIPLTTVEESGITYRQRTFVAPRGKEGSASVGVVEFIIENMGDKPADAALEIAVSANADKEDVAEISAVPAGVVAYRRGRLLAAFQTGEAKPLKLDLMVGGLRLSGSVPPRVTSRLVAFIPTEVLKPEQHTLFSNADDLLRATREYWTAQLAPAMQVEVPDPLLANTIKASQVHCLIAARNEENFGRIAAWIASFEYGPLETEAHSVIRGMDFFGHHDFARKSLDYFVHRYSPEGMLTTGYTMMGPGWHLWMLGEHYGLTRDQEWIKKVAPDVGRVCKWIVAQRQKTMQEYPDGSKPVEYGLVPPGVMADWNAFAFHFCLNAYYCAGLRSAADALADAGVADAAGWREVAVAYRDSILRAFAWTRAMMPVYRLRDGTSVPGYPSQMHSPGPTGNFFPGEDGNRSWCYDIELGSHHLVPLGVLAADSKETAWMMDHMEDVQFLSNGWFDYPAERSGKDWYNLGGFAKVQPYYCRNAEVCAMRDDVKPFIRTYFNTIPSLLNMENLSFQEHFAGVAAWNKTHETGYFLHQTRMMLVFERGDDLWLAPFVTNNWLKDGMAVAVQKAPTRFGPVSYRIASGVGQGFIEATIDPPTRTSPRQIVLRLRHPEGKPMQKVTVNGQPHQDFDPAKEIVRISPAGEKITVRASY
jgi:hypothetical protein